MCVLFLNQIFFVFVSAYEPNHPTFGEHLAKHGDAVKDVAYAVEDLDAVVEVSRLSYNHCLDIT